MSFALRGGHGGRGVCHRWAGEFLREELWVDVSVFKNPTPPCVKRIRFPYFSQFPIIKVPIPEEAASFLACIGGNLSPRKGSKL